LIEKTFTLKNKLGIHARPAAELVKLAGKYKSKIALVTEKKTADAKSLLLVMSLGAKMEDVLTVKIEGEDETEAMSAFETLITNKFYED